VVLIELFFRTRRSFPRLFCIMLIASAAFALVDDVVVSALSSESHLDVETQADLARAVVMAGFWVAYFRLSKRVAATFVF
jgi:hypothetical protein